MKLDQHVKLLKSEFKPSKEIVLEEVQKFFQLQDEILALKNKFLVLDLERETGELYFSRLFSAPEFAEKERLIDICCYGFNKDVHQYLKPEGYFVARKKWFCKQAGIVFDLKEFEEYEAERFGTTSHINDRYGKWLNKW